MHEHCDELLTTWDDGPTFHYCVHDLDFGWNGSDYKTSTTRSCHTHGAKCDDIRLCQSTILRF